MKYNIISKSGNTLEKGKTLDEAIQYKIDNIATSDNFEIVEAKSTKEKKSEMSEEDFIKTLSAAQSNDIHLGYKQLKFAKGSWGLVRIKDVPETSHYSHQEAKRNREGVVLAHLKKAIRADEDTILRTLHLICPNVMEEEFEHALKTILK